MTIQERFDRAQHTIDSYQYGGEAMAEKTLVALIAPTAVGKSTLAHYMLDTAREQGVDIAEVGTWTTRPGRADDPDQYRTGIAMDVMLDAIEQREVINWAPHPSGALYASVAESYPGHYNVLPMLPDTLPMMRRAGFKAIYAYYMTATAEAWQPHLEERRGHQFTDRLREARDSLEWAEHHIDELTILHNQEGKTHLHALARAVLDDIRGLAPIVSDRHAEEHISSMKALVNQMLDTESEATF